MSLNISLAGRVVHKKMFAWKLITTLQPYPLGELIPPIWIGGCSHNFKAAQMFFSTDSIWFISKYIYLIIPLSVQSALSILIPDWKITIQLIFKGNKWTNNKESTKNSPSADACCRQVRQVGWVGVPTHPGRCCWCATCTSGSGTAGANRVFGIRAQFSFHAWPARFRMTPSIVSTDWSWCCDTWHSLWILQNWMNSIIKPSWPVILCALSFFYTKKCTWINRMPRNRFPVRLPRYLSPFLILCFLSFVHQTHRLRSVCRIAISCSTGQTSRRDAATDRVSCPAAESAFLWDRATSRRGGRSGNRHWWAWEEVEDSGS